MFTLRRPPRKVVQGCAKISVAFDLRLHHTMLFWLAPVTSLRHEKADVREKRLPPLNLTIVLSLLSLSVCFLSVLLLLLLLSFLLLCIY